MTEAAALAKLQAGADFVEFDEPADSDAGCEDFMDGYESGRDRKIRGWRGDVETGVFGYAGVDSGWCRADGEDLLAGGR